jgi:hypothetical protein
MINDTALVHDYDLVGYPPNGLDVVADEEHSKVSARLQVFEEFQNLRLDGHVQGRHHFVAHDKSGIAQQSARYANSLALTAGKLVRISARVARLQPNFLERGGDP